MTRFLAVHPGPNFSVADVHRGWVDALCGLGVQISDCNLGDRLEFYLRSGLPAEDAVRLTNNSLHATCYQYRPDVLFVTSCMYLTAAHLDAIRDHGTRIVILHTESPYEDDVQVRRASKADLNLINDPTNLDRFREVAPTHYMPHAYRPDVHYPRPPSSVDHKSDFCFVGTGYPSRIDLLSRVDWSGIDVALGGHWTALSAESPLRQYVVHDIDECLPNERAADLYAGTKCSVNIYRREANAPELVDGWSLSPREVELAAMAVPFARERRGEGDRLLSALPTFDGPQELSVAIRWLLTHPRIASSMANTARAAVANRTFAIHARQLLRLLDV